MSDILYLFHNLYVKALPQSSLFSKSSLDTKSSAINSQNLVLNSSGVPYSNSFINLLFVVYAKIIKQINYKKLVKIFVFIKNSCIKIWFVLVLFHIFANNVLTFC